MTGDLYEGILRDGRMTFQSSALTHRYGSGSGSSSGLYCFSMTMAAGWWALQSQRRTSAAVSEAGFLRARNGPSPTLTHGIIEHRETCKLTQRQDNTRQ